MDHCAGHAYSGLLTTDAYKRKRKEMQKTTHDLHEAARGRAAQIVAADQAAAKKEAEVSWTPLHDAVGRN